MDNRPIGIFDSGVGGLTVVKAVMKELPKENIIYFGDTARLPYGSKSKEVVTKLSKDVKTIIVACNTASSNSLVQLQQYFDVPIFGVVDAGVKEALATTRNKKIGVIGTASTIRSGAYKDMIYEANQEMQVFSKACPLFVPLAEEGWNKSHITYEVAKEYLKELMEYNVDSLVLGCTHYPLLKQCIGEVVGKKVSLVDPAKATAKAVKDFLDEKRMNNEEGISGAYEFFLSDETEMFSSICKDALKKEYGFKVVDIETY